VFENRVSTSVKISRGLYILISIAVILIVLYVSNPIPYIDLNKITFIGPAIFYVTMLAIAIDIAIASLFKYIGLDIVSSSGLEIVEGSDKSLEFVIKPPRASGILIVKKIYLYSDTGLKISRWRFSREDQRLEVYVSGYPGKHLIEGFELEFETPLSILRIVYKHILAKPIEVKVVPTESRHMFNVEAVVPYLPIVEGRSSRRKGVGSEVISVREFTPHDDYKKIHWKATAKIGKFMVKEYEHRMYRNAFLVISIHYFFYLGDPPPLVFLFKIVIDIVKTLTSRGMRVSLGVITEEDIKIVEFIDRFRVHEVYRVLSDVKWPRDLSATVIRYTSSNRILRWFIQTVTKDVCRDPCIAILAVDPLDDLDINAVAIVSNFLRSRKHSVKILLTTPSTLRFMYSARVGMENLSEVMGEITRIKRILARFGFGEVYLPTIYLKTES
jgi:hypothetical protein